MFSVLGALYRGELNPDETVVPSHPDYRPLNRQIALLREQLRNQLNEQDCSKLEELFCLCDKSNGLHREAAFIQGFKLGAAMEMEVLLVREELARSIAPGRD